MQEMICKIELYDLNIDSIRDFLNDVERRNALLGVTGGIYNGTYDDEPPIYAIWFKKRELTPLEKERQALIQKVCEDLERGITPTFGPTE